MAITIPVSVCMSDSCRSISPRDSSDQLSNPPGPRMTSQPKVRMTTLVISGRTMRMIRPVLTRGGVRAMMTASGKPRTRQIPVMIRDRRKVRSATPR